MDLKLGHKLDLRLGQGLQNVQLLELKAEREIEEEAEEETLLAEAEAAAAEPPALEDVGDGDRVLGEGEAGLFDDPAEAGLPVLSARAARLRLRFRIVPGPVAGAFTVFELPGSRSHPARLPQLAVANAIALHLAAEAASGRTLERPGDWAKIRPIGGLGALGELAGEELEKAQGAAVEVARGFLLELPNGDVVAPDALVFPAGKKSEAARDVTAAAVLASQPKRPNGFRAELGGWTDADWTAFRRTASFDDRRRGARP